MTMCLSYHQVRSASVIALSRRTVLPARLLDYQCDYDLFMSLSQRGILTLTLDHHIPQHTFLVTRIKFMMQDSGGGYWKTWASCILQCEFIG